MKLNIKNMNIEIFPLIFYVLVKPIISISHQNMVPTQSLLRPISPNINNTSSSSSSIQIIQFNNETRIAFGLMLERSKDSS